MPESSAVRDHLANERTHLAWLRTSANVIVVGLAVARFADGGEVTSASLVAGGILILTGAVGAGYGTLRYRRAARAIRSGVIDEITASTGPTVATVVLLVAVLVSAVVLLAGSSA
jgi:uncharacterized membrane protein YidH (DUF202 family)